jgi:hypothetical protein
VHQKNNDCDLEHKQNNIEKYYWLWKLVENGKQLDHAEEAQFEALEAVQERGNKQQHEWYY